MQWNQGPKAKQKKNFFSTCLGFGNPNPCLYLHTKVCRQGLSDVVHNGQKHFKETNKRKKIGKKNTHEFMVGFVLC